MMSKTKIDKRKERKTNPELVETIELAKKNNLLELAKKISGPTRLQKRVNVGELNNINGEVIVTGKVLGQGQINKKIKISALGFSEEAREKLKKAGCEMKTIKQKIKEDNKLEGIEII